MKLSVENVSFAYGPGKKLFSGLNFSLESGRIMSILGPNGIGKTTLLKCLVGTLDWQTGNAYFDGHDLSHYRMRKIFPLGYVPQAHHSSFPYTVEDMVIMGRARFIGLFGVPSDRDREIAQKAMKTVGILDIRRRRCDQLSGGQLQLVFIARALAGQPKVLVLDEPESHLDFKNQFFILELIQTLASQEGITCIMNTHYPQHALRFSDVTLLLGGLEHLFGETSQVITENNVRRWFNIESSISSLSFQGETVKTFSVLGLSGANYLPRVSSDQNTA